jgi:hypothetical protein
MRWLLAVCLCGFGCVNEVNYYYGAPGADGGAGDMSGYTDQYGDYHDEGGSSIFKEGAKLQGNALLTLQEAPAQVVGPGGNQFWPRTALDVPVERAAAVTLIDVATKDEEPHVVTIVLGDLTGPPPTGEALNSPTEVVAILDLGIGGVAMLTEIDYMRGVQFSLAITRLQLHVVYRTIPGGHAISIPPPQYRVAASLATGAVAHGRQPQRTLARHALAAFGDDAWFIPMFAKSFRATAVANNTQLDVEMRDSAYGPAEALYQAVAYPTPDWPIGSDAQTIRVVNRMAAGSADYNLIFELAL